MPHIRYAAYADMPQYAAAMLLLRAMPQRADDAAIMLPYAYAILRCAALICPARPLPLFSCCRLRLMLPPPYAALLLMMPFMLAAFDADAAMFRQMPRNRRRHALRIF